MNRSIDFKWLERPRLANGSFAKGQVQSFKITFYEQAKKVAHAFVRVGINIDGAHDNRRSMKGLGSD